MMFIVNYLLFDYFIKVSIYFNFLKLYYNKILEILSKNIINYNVKHIFHLELFYIYI